VPDQGERRQVELLHQPGDVAEQVAHPVVVDLLRLVGEVVAAQVGRHDAVVPAEVGELVAPQVPELREAVHEQDRLALAAGHVVDPGLGVRIAVFDLDLHSEIPAVASASARS
jgi:hypothetical protein